MHESDRGRSRPSSRQLSACVVTDADVGTSYVGDFAPVVGCDNVRLTRMDVVQFRDGREVAGSLLVTGDPAERVWAIWALVNAVRAFKALLYNLDGGSL